MFPARNLLLSRYRLVHKHHVCDRMNEGQGTNGSVELFCERLRVRKFLLPERIHRLYQPLRYRILALKTL